MDKAKTRFSPGFGLFLSLVTLAAAFVFFTTASSASAAFEEVATFGGGNAQLASSTVEGTSSAVNLSGAGGVPAGTVYMVAELADSVAVYTPNGELREIWGWGVAEEGGGYQRCGPDGEPLHPTCAPYRENEGLGQGGNAESAGEGQLNRPKAIAVDQHTGDVYVLNANRDHAAIQVFSADGSEIIGGFGERSNPGLFPERPASIEETPTELHDIGPINGIAVNEAGRVYVPDLDYAEIVGTRQARIVSFVPTSPGEYQHYVYAGRADDIQVPYSTSFQSVRLDAAGSLFGMGETRVVEYGGAGDLITCELSVPTGGILSMAVNSNTGEVLYSSAKNNLIHRLSSCDAQGTFEEVESIASEPRQKLSGISINPNLEFSPSRSLGVVYAIQPHAGTDGIHEEGLARVYAGIVVTPPVISGVRPANVTSTSATLVGSVNPRGPATTFRFEYLTRSAYEANEVGSPFLGAVEAPLGGGRLSAGTEASTVTVGASGLTPDTDYYFRLLADNCAGTEEPDCEAESSRGFFRTFPSASGSGLPDERAWELVSPPAKEGGEVFPLEPFVSTPSCLECKPGGFAYRYPVQSAPDGDRIAYQGEPFSSQSGTGNPNEYLSERTSEGWRTTALNPPLLEQNSLAGARAFSADLERDVLGQRSPSLTPAAPLGTANLYIQNTLSPSSLAPILQSAGPNVGDQMKVTFAGASANLDHVFFSADDALTEATASEPAAFYEPGRANLYESIDGVIRLINVLPGNESSVPGASFGEPHMTGVRTEALEPAISADGEMVYWTAPSGQVYVREDGVRTIELPDHSGGFTAASTDGRKVLLSDGHLLTVAEGGGTSEVDLTGGAGGFLGIVGESNDLSNFYFADEEALTTSPNLEGEHAVTGFGNIFSWSETSGEVTFVAAVGPAEVQEYATDWAQSPVERTAQSSPDGGWLAFTTNRSLANSANNLGPCAKNFGTEFVEAPCRNVFLYGAASRRLVCASCSRSGEAPLGNSTLVRLERASPAFKQPRYLTNAGRLYFDSPNRLSAVDNNKAEDVYEFESAGSGTCAEPSGCVELISSGTGRYDANLMEVDEDGENVFFTTRNQLTPRDTDGLVDLYDARERGGLASETANARSECQGEACQSPAPVTSLPTVSSSVLPATATPVKAKHKKKARPGRHRRKKSKKHRSRPGRGHREDKGRHK